MGEAYPEIASQRELIMKVIKEEEDSFLRTLDKGYRHSRRGHQNARKQGKNEISGKEAFVLYDTYGFPLDLTRTDTQGKRHDSRQKGIRCRDGSTETRARNAAAVEATDWVTVSEGETEFVGYDVTSAPTRILRYRRVTPKNKEFYQIVLSTTLRSMPKWADR